MRKVTLPLVAVACLSLANAQSDTNIYLNSERVFDVHFGEFDRTVSGDFPQWQVVEGFSSDYLRELETFINVHSIVGGRADLSQGLLGTKAGITILDDLGNVAPGTDEVWAFAAATLRDGFTSYDRTGALFDWSGKSAAFNFSIDGFNSGLSEITLGNSEIFTSLHLVIGKSGYNQAFDHLEMLIGQGAYGTDAFEEALQEYNSLFLENLTWYDSSALLPDWAIQDAEYSEHSFLADFTASPVLQHTFVPGGDFDFQLLLESSVGLDVTNFNIPVMTDFYSTITTSYQAPEGAVTFSNSGVFPNTLAMPTEAVPDATNTIALLLLSSLSFVFVKRATGRKTRR